MDTQGNNTPQQSADKIYNIDKIENATFVTQAPAMENKPFNEYLTKELLAAIRPYSKPATKFMELVKDKPDWNQRASISDQAKDILAYSFVGVLGIQLRKLMAIGKESISENKQRNYIDNCISTGKRSLQILCFALISDLWNKKKEKDYSLSAEQEDILKHFFEDLIEMGVRDYMVLFRNLYALYKTNNFEFPLPELTDTESQLQPDSDLSKACEQMHIICETADTDKYTLKNCEEAEIQLTKLLSGLSFLAAYKMVSMKGIGYEEVRNTTPRYLHNYIALGFDSKINVNTERLNYLDAPMSTDCILLFKGNYLHSINLFPFIIDLNALTFEGGVKIFFYSCMAMDDNTMNFRFLEDNSIESISYSDTLKADTQINDLLEDKEKRKKIKLDTVFLQFREAKNTILGEINIDLSDN